MQKIVLLKVPHRPSFLTLSSAAGSGTDSPCLSQTTSHRKPFRGSVNLLESLTNSMKRSRPLADAVYNFPSPNLFSFQQACRRPPTPSDTRTYSVSHKSGRRSTYLQVTAGLHIPLPCKILKILAHGSLLHSGLSNFGLQDSYVNRPQTSRAWIVIFPCAALTER